MPVSGETMATLGLRVLQLHLSRQETSHHDSQPYIHMFLYWTGAQGTHV